MLLLDDEALVDAHFGLFGDSAGTRFALNVPQALKSLWTHPMELLGDVGHVDSCFGLFRDSVSVGVR
jgi:hypothetical protein